MSQILIDKYNGEVPSSFDALEELPGVGRKTANVVLNEAFHIPTVAVDTHVFRVSNRTGLALGKTPHEVETKLIKRIPRVFTSCASLVDFTWQIYVLLEIQNVQNVLFLLSVNNFAKYSVDFI